ncbi:unnamed protein product [Pedinophyceae sp. YPF-701]|nr:unnamed protein product [Pedinophyceae sp. YPF-701]
MQAARLPTPSASLGARLSARASRATSAAGRPAPRRSLVARAEASRAPGEPAPWSEPGYLDAVVSALPDAQQQAVVAGIFAGLGLGTYVTLTQVVPVLEQAFGGNTLYQLNAASQPWILGLTFMAAGYAHFGLQQGFLDMMPHQGAFGGLWQLPGSDKFHVEWTGVAELVGGAGLLLGAIDRTFSLGLLPTWVEPAAALGLFFLVIAVSPANIYMYTNNAPGPVPEVIPPAGHFVRFLLQIALLSVLWGLAKF